jgi:hypothetical protein
MNHQPYLIAQISNFSYQNEFIVKGRGCYFPFLFNPKKETSHEEATQNALSMLPVEGGCSVGSLM